MSVKKKIKQYLDQPVIFAVVLVVVIVLIAAILSQGKKELKQQEVAQSQQSESRSGQQVAKISIKGENGSEQTTSETQAESTQAQTTQPESTPAESPESDEHMTTAKTLDGVASPAGNRVKYKISTFQKLAVQPLKFNIYDEKGAEITPEYLVTEREQKVHFVLASANLKEYQHLHPEYKNGVWNVDASMPTPGTYYAYVDIVPVKGDPIVLRSDLIVRQPTSGEIKYPGVTPDAFAMTDGYKTQLQLQGNKTSNEKQLTFTVTKDGKPVTDAKPYLGAFGHVILLRHGGPDGFVHLHPSVGTDETKGILSFSAYVSKPGRYTAFAEFKVGDQVRLFPITFDIE